MYLGIRKAVQQVVLQLLDLALVALDLQYASKRDAFSAVQHSCLENVKKEDHGNMIKQG